ncbi:MAG: 50S ribosomal protein L9 [Candidatus Zambryskibacteria bacterium RIFOXYD1_FULL_40_13]|nr:MAG: 50S ribosomal protein L9 [Parcubacteria group bacterium GW2011_GWC1_39_12]KKR19723.1 MAG: 50S ribosomal protein L9 [Parcubacteria group bacterium GW2011_GWF1_39_37]KKR35879.1 MAG: 50S ribosomal protein L9 [Parcubacteria group bacterium GW2011_GWC2_40_10]KKR52691.1 MAG: 50S ribosomal protein L9 [Parcubacteria group bacterium GW2011_GWE1_40_20]KKR66491.1 MAG: 50S ribosomal protein L9 [Parcubacteria group bacterium GW2011_GWB1_40_5]KKR69129.1 MAG: 50S ribosomal protein L9 [Parcubacteria g
MKIILLKDIPKVGKKYDIKNVADGYALNLLIPKGLAQIATSQSEKNIELMKSKDMVERKIQVELLLKNLEVIKTLVINLKEKANEKGHLFAGITKERLVEEIIKTARLNLDPESIILEKPIKEIGEYKVAVEVLGKRAEFAVVVEAK